MFVLCSVLCLHFISLFAVIMFFGDYCLCNVCVKVKKKSSGKVLGLGKTCTEGADMSSKVEETVMIKKLRSLHIDQDKHLDENVSQNDNRLVEQNFSK